MCEKKLKKISNLEREPGKLTLAENVNDNVVALWTISPFLWSMGCPFYLAFFAFSTTMKNFSQFFNEIYFWYNYEKYPFKYEIIKTRN